MTFKSFIFYIIIIILTVISTGFNNNDKKELAGLFNQIAIILISFVIALKIPL